MNKVLILAPVYIPGVKGGGPIQSIKNLIEILGDDIDFYIITSDRDLGDSSTYTNIKTDEIIKVGKAKVIYTDIDKLNASKLAHFINKIQPQTLYLNSFFSYKFSILPMILQKFKIINISNTILAPRGEFSLGALKLKDRKKKIYITLSKLLNLYKNIRWHATAKTEHEDIERVFSESVDISIISNFTDDYSNFKYTKELHKYKGNVRLMYLSRIHPKKNLKFSLENLKYVKGNVEFDIYGPIEDEVYWEECLAIIEKLPKNIMVNYRGILEHDMVLKTFQEYHFFYFLTLGENFGHVIAESFISGTPVIISDQTPWLNLEEKGVGWNVPLSNTRKIQEVLENLIDIDQDIYRDLSIKAFEYGRNVLDITVKKEMMLSLFKGDNDA